MPKKLLKNRYLIEDVDRDKLGAGSFGSTYLARDTRYRSFVKKVVVKHLQPPLGLFDTALKFFQREAEVLGKLGSEHGQIPTLVDSFDEDNNFYIVQEWIDGETLSGILTYGQRLNQKDTIDLLIEILEPLKFCHDEGTIHRDLKPANLMRRRSDHQLVIIDFGAVREIGQLILLPNGQEQPGSIICSKGYGSPEQCTGNPVLASDVYAVGAIGIQAMTGLPPHLIDTPFGEIPRWWEVSDRSNATTEFTEILNKMLAFSPKVRYADASAALEALRPLTNEHSPTAQQAAVAVSVVMPRPENIQSVTVDLATTNIAQTSIGQKFQGSLSQEIFTFETAQPERVLVDKIEVVKKSGWLGLGTKEEQVTTKLEEWQINKIQKTGAERFIEDLGKNIKLEMVYVPAGSFLMGAEKSGQLVMVTDFYMGRYPVTQEQYFTIMDENPAHWQNNRLPVERVSWGNAQVFCQKLNAKTGKKYRLPSEAEWEYACKAGTVTPFYFGETINTELANYNGNCLDKSGVQGVYRAKTTAVGSFPANGFGLHDMHGNVWEWCEDQWQENYQEEPANGIARINDHDYRLLRGGSWSSHPHNCSAAYRHKRSADNRCSIIGFRLVCGQNS
jgi:eukaryotic-like serine/threonine-protein kinase